MQLLDVNNDGLADIIGRNGNTIKVTLNNGSGGYGDTSIFNTGNTVTSFSLGDFDHDGYLDVVSGGGTTLTILKNDQRGGFSVSSTKTVSNNIASVSASDFNRDGEVDLFIGYSAGTNTAELLNGSNSGSTFTTSATFAGAVGSGRAVIGDFNGDGVADVAISTGASKTVSVFTNDGSGNFSTQSVNIASNAFDLTVGDTDGNGSTDIFVRGGTTLLRRISGVATTTTQLQYTDISSRNGALSATSTFDAILERIQRERASLGAVQRRVEAALRAITGQRDNSLQAAGRITDIDVAQESANYIKNQISQQLAAKVLKQISLQPKLVLSLLKE